MHVLYAAAFFPHKVYRLFRGLMENARKIYTLSIMLNNDDVDEIKKNICFFFVNSSFLSAIVFVSHNYCVELI